MKENGKGAFKTVTVKNDRKIFPIYNSKTYTVTFVGNFCDGTEYVWNEDDKLKYSCTFQKSKKTDGFRPVVRQRRAIHVW